MKELEDLIKEKEFTEVGYVKGLIESMNYAYDVITKKKLNVIGYARVSSKKQSDDLERQINNLNTYISSKYDSFDIITDIGSGINYNKPGLKKLIEKINKK